MTAKRPNRCKKLTTRRLLARRPSGRLLQSALRGGALSAKPFSKRRTKRAAVFVACEAALQLMRQSLAGPRYLQLRRLRDFSFTDLFQQFLTCLLEKSCRVALRL